MRCTKAPLWLSTPHTVCLCGIVYFTNHTMSCTSHIVNHCGWVPRSISSAGSTSRIHPRSPPQTRQISRTPSQAEATSARQGAAVAPKHTHTPNNGSSAACWICGKGEVTRQTAFHPRYIPSS